MFGPKFTLYANGAELLHSYPVSIVTHGIGLNITLQSYRDHLDFGFIAGANILPNVQSLADSLPDELTKLEAADDSPHSCDPAWKDDPLRRGIGVQD